MSKFPWGDEPVAPWGIPVIFAIIPTFSAIVTYFANPTVGAAKGDIPTVDELNLMILGTCTYMAIFWALYLGAQNMMKVMYGLSEQAEKVGGRLLGNFMESVPPLLITTWLYALRVNPRFAGIFLLATVPSRLIYPYAYTYYLEATQLISFNTTHGYSTCWCMIIGVFYKCLTGGDLYAKWYAISPAMSIVIGLLVFFVWFPLTALAGGWGLPQLAKAAEERMAKNQVLIPK